MVKIVITIGIILFTTMRMRIMSVIMPMVPSIIILIFIFLIAMILTFPFLWQGSGA